MTDLEIPETGAIFTFGKSRFAENKPSHFFIKNDPVTQVACGDEHTAVICKNGRIFAFGSNEWGQLGLGHNNMVHKPSCIKALKPEKTKFIACGRAHTIILTESNNIYACGSNTDGQLGLDNVDMVNIPTKLQHNQLKDNGVIKKLAAGSQHSAALTESGLVFVWGSNSEGQLGFETNRTTSKFPTLLEFKDKIRDICCGYYHTAVLTENGDLYTFGENENGKLGLPQGDSQTYKPTRVNVPAPLETISCGGHHNIGLTKTGEVVAFGSNNNGELGFGKDVQSVAEPKILPNELFEGETVRSVSCGDSHSAFITENDKIYTCGDTRHGKLCLDDATSEEGQFGPQQITRFANYKVTNVSCGGCHTIICAQKQPENWQNASLPPLQRVPNTIINEIKTEAALETTEKHVNGDMSHNGIETFVENHKNMNGISHDVQLNSAEESLKNTQNIENSEHIENIENIEDIERLPAHLSEIIKTQKEQLDAEYEKTINTIKTEENTILDEINEVTGLKPLKDNLASDSVDNLLQEIEDDLSNKSSKTFTSDTISVKSNSNGKSAEDIEPVATETKVDDGNDDEDLKVQPERKFSRLFGTFKRKKVSASSTDSKIIERKNSDEIKVNEEIQGSKTEKTKTCTIL